MSKTVSSASAPLRPTPTDNPGLPKILGEFETLTAALDYAARGATGFNFYSARGELAHVMPFKEATTYHILWSDAVLIEAPALGHALSPIVETQPAPAVSGLTGSRWRTN